MKYAPVFVGSLYFQIKKCVKYIFSITIKVFIVATSGLAFSPFSNVNMSYGCVNVVIFKFPRYIATEGNAGIALTSAFYHVFICCLITCVFMLHSYTRK